MLFTSPPRGHNVMSDVYVLYQRPQSSKYYSLHSSPTEQWEARLRTEGRESPLESKQTQNWRNKEEGGIWNTWALWECQIGWTKANCDGWKVCIGPSLSGKDYKIMTQVIFPQTLVKVLWVYFTDRPFSVQMRVGRHVDKLGIYCEWTCCLNINQFMVTENTFSFTFWPSWRHVKFFNVNAAFSLT